MTDLRERFPKHERIYLQEGMGDEGSTTWCQDRINDDDPEYIQIEKYNELQSKYESLLRQVKGAKRVAISDIDYNDNSIEFDHALNSFDLLVLDDISKNGSNNFALVPMPLKEGDES